MTALVEKKRDKLAKAFLASATFWGINDSNDTFSIAPLKPAAQR